MLTMDTNRKTTKSKINTDLNENWVKAIVQPENNENVWPPCVCVCVFLFCFNLLLLLMLLVSSIYQALLFG